MANNDASAKSTEPLNGKKWKRKRRKRKNRVKDKEENKENNKSGDINNKNTSDVDVDNGDKETTISKDWTGVETNVAEGDNSTTDELKVLSTKENNEKNLLLTGDNENGREKKIEKENVIVNGLSHNGENEVVCEQEEVEHSVDNSEDQCFDDINDMEALNFEEEKHFCNVCFSFLYYKKYCFYELLRIYRSLCLLKEEEKQMLSESIYCKVYKMYIAILNNYFFILNMLFPQIPTHILIHLLSCSFQRDEKEISEETVVNQIVDNLTPKEKEDIDKIYNIYNFNARLLSKDDIYVLLDEYKFRMCGDYISCSTLLNNRPRNMRHTVLNRDCSQKDIPEMQYEIEQNEQNHSTNIMQEHNLYTENMKYSPTRNCITEQKESCDKIEDNDLYRENSQCTSTQDSITELKEDIAKTAEECVESKQVSVQHQDASNLKRYFASQCDSATGDSNNYLSPNETREENVETEQNEESEDKFRHEHVSPGMRIHTAFTPNLDDYTLIQNLSKVRSTLRQFIRDWSSEGRRERVSAYGPLLESLQKYLPIKKNYVPSILCPGSGLGRLPYEVAKRGYNSQGNEFSYFMLLASNYILNYYNEKNSLHIQPYCLSTSNRRRKDDHLKVINFPDTNVYNNSILKTEFSMCAGELIEVYYTEKQKFDGILTCFFLDTAKNIFMYIRTFANILKPKGLWSNIGPLLFHYAEIPNEMSIELAWDEIKDIISKWFTFIEIRWIDNYYTTNFDSMMQVQYHCIFFNARRNNVPVED